MLPVGPTAGEATGCPKTGGAGSADYSSVALYSRQLGASAGDASATTTDTYAAAEPFYAADAAVVPEDAYARRQNSAC